MPLISQARPRDQIDPKLILKLSAWFKQFEIDHNQLFLEREDLIRQIIFALLMREHILIVGSTGTGKSGLIKSTCGCFPDAKVFAQPMSGFTTDSRLFGTINPKTLRDYGIQEPQFAGTVVLAHLAILDEFLDGNVAVLRGPTLNWMNERVYLSGDKIYGTNLHTLFAPTNHDPIEAVRRQPLLAAVVDRFLFTANVVEIQDQSHQLTAVTNAAEKLSTDLTFPFSELREVSSYIRECNLIVDQFIYNAYVEILLKFEEWLHKQKGGVITTRTRTNMIQLLEAAAVLDGRDVVFPSDLFQLYLGVCTSGDPDQKQAFERIATPIIEKAIAQNSVTIEDLELKQLLSFEEQLDQVAYNRNDADTLVTASRALTHLKEQIQTEVVAQSAKAKKHKAQLLEAVEEKSKQVQTAITRG